MYEKNKKGETVKKWLNGMSTEVMSGGIIRSRYNENKVNYYLVENTLGGKSWHAEWQLIPFASGGYTGEWGPEGKWALLHQKEIVLNAKDTENLLNAVEVVRQLENRVAAQHLGLLGKMDSVYHTNLANQGTLEQQVNIEAVFPSVTDRNEIQEAFNSLVNQAAQYASELKRRKG